jgi:hypothetical protein
MGRPVKVKIKDEVVDGEELEFEPLRETWNEYRCEDGTYVKLKVVVSKITRLAKLNAQGEPLHQVLSTNVMAVTPSMKREQST